MRGDELQREREWLRTLTAEIEAELANWKPEYGDYREKDKGELAA